MNLNADKWERFMLGNLFDIKKGKRLTSEDQEPGSNIYIGAIDSNNGVANHIAQEPIHEKNTISLSYNGSVGEAFYQPEDYWATDDVNALYPKFDGFNQYIGLFISAVIRKEKYRFSYGRKWTLENMKTTEICLPICRDNVGEPIIDNEKKYSEEGYLPDFRFMEDYIKTLHYKPLTTKNLSKKENKIDTSKWKDFYISKLFDVTAGNYYYSSEYDIGTTPYISASDTNNGISKRIDLEPDFKGNAITIGKIGATTYYQSEDFCATSDVNILRPRFEMNCYSGLFIAQVLNYSENYKWNYGRQCRIGDTNKIVIKLPVETMEDGNPVYDKTKKYSEDGYLPDLKFMENYIRNLPFGDRL